jgi:uncharacterized repeat protein (TIGR04076 family)
VSFIAASLLLLRGLGRWAIYQYVFALSHGADSGLFYYGDWIKTPGVAICSCNDGLRPVIFMIETIEE